MYKLLHYIFFSILLTSLLSAKELEEYTEVGIKSPTFILIFVIILLLSYKAISLYRSKKEKDIHAQISTSTHLLQTDESLLAEAKDLINFLKTNNQTFETDNEIFRVQNLLNEVYGLIEPIIQKHNIEFIYDVDNSIPIELVGDTILLEQALYNLISYALDSTQDSTVIVKFKKTKKDEQEQLNIEVTNSKKPIDINRTKEEESSFRAVEELIQHMKGTLFTKETQQGTSYNITLPFLCNDLYQETYYSLPETIIGKKVLLIEDKQYTANAISQIFERFNLDLKIENSNKLSEIQSFDSYDIIILDANLLTHVLIRHLEEIKTNKMLKVISLETLFGQRDRRFKPNKLIDKYLYKPLSKGMVFGLLYEAYVIQQDDNFTVNEENRLPNKSKSSEIVFIEEISDITRESFQDFDNIHILVVEDNKINQKIIQSVLEKSKIQISIANNGLEALELLDKEKTIDIVLMDINMPIMDGYQATKKIRENNVLSSLPIVVVSGLGFRNEIEQMYLAGADAHLTKPFKIGQLYAAFKMFLHEDSDQVASEDEKIVQYTEDKNILDTDKGISSMQNVLSYRDALREILVTLRHSDELVKERIIKKEFDTLYNYCVTTLGESEFIGATSLSNILNEIIILVGNKEEQLLQKYILLYRDEWIKTKRNIELYLKSVDSF